ncbi:MAG: hypothetical protein RBT74_00610 [Tenuifilaceae bacterium]|jgi:hypothetical protein|nr:hypothetical protein [Tenuifilaceae bacterium]
MKKLTLTNAEFSHLREIYLVELEKAQRRIEHLSSILMKIDSEFDPNADVEVLEAEEVVTRGKKTRRKTSYVIGDTRKPRRASKPRKPISRGAGDDKVKWNDFVFNTIVEKNAPTLSSEIQQLAITTFQIQESDVPRVRQVISGALSKLVTLEKKLRTQKVPGSREKWYGPVSWFGGDGSLLPEYQAKIEANS